MGKYKFSIDAFYATKNNYLEINEYEKELFEIDGRKVMLRSLNKDKKIKDADGIKIECGFFSDIEECVVLAKKIYSNFLIRLNNTDISYILDKSSKGNFKKYYKAKDANVYKEIFIEDLENKNRELYIILENGGCGCTHFYFNKLLDMEIDSKLKDSLAVNNYRKFLIGNDIESKVDNTLFVASIEMLLDNKEKRCKEELDVIDEICEYLSNRYKENNKEEYLKIKEMIQNNKHKTIGNKIQEIIEQNSDEDEGKINVEKMKKISRNRTKEVHVSSKEKVDTVFSWGILNKIQSNYAKKVYMKNNLE